MLSFSCAAQLGLCKFCQGTAIRRSQRKTRHNFIVI
uniref:Uncharacterized protein n=1 Tax=Anguilla anguilla TaxID=7936 RepID=A0A0E9R443_ANGAN